jgi:hypothetical protein
LFHEANNSLIVEHILYYCTLIADGGINANTFSGMQFSLSPSKAKCSPSTAAEIGEEMR